MRDSKCCSDHLLSNENISLPVILCLSQQLIFERLLVTFFVCMGRLSALFNRVLLTHPSAGEDTDQRNVFYSALSVNTWCWFESEWGFSLGESASWMGFHREPLENSGGRSGILFWLEFFLQRDRTPASCVKRRFLWYLDVTVWFYVCSFIIVIIECTVTCCLQWEWIQFTSRSKDSAIDRLLSAPAQIDGHMTPAWTC